MGPMHQRILGTWKSDRKKTFSNFPGYKESSLARKRKLGRIFGHLEIKYTACFLSTNIDGFRQKTRYEVVAEDHNSLVLRETACSGAAECDDALKALVDLIDPSYFQTSLRHLRFETIRGQDYYWFSDLLLGRSLYAEWFRRIN